MSKEPKTWISEYIRNEYSPDDTVFNTCNNVVETT